MREFIMLLKFSFHSGFCNFFPEKGKIGGLMNHQLALTKKSLEIIFTGMRLTFKLLK